MAIYIDPGGKNHLLVLKLFWFIAWSWKVLELCSFWYWPTWDPCLNLVILRRVLNILLGWPIGVLYRFWMWLDFAPHHFPLSNDNHINIYVIIGSSNIYTAVTTWQMKIYTRPIVYRIWMKLLDFASSWKLSWWSAAVVPYYPCHKVSMFIHVLYIWIVLMPTPTKVLIVTE